MHRHDHWEQRGCWQLDAKLLWVIEDMDVSEALVVHSL